MILYKHEEVALSGKNHRSGLQSTVDGPGSCFIQASIVLRRKLVWRGLPCRGLWTVDRGLIKFPIIIFLHPFLAASSRFRIVVS